MTEAALVVISEGHPTNSVAMAEIYNTDRFAELYYAARNAPMANVGLAARFLIELFQTHAIPFAFLGGWAIHLRGNTRATEDVDIAVGVDMDRLKQILLAESRYETKHRYSSHFLSISADRCYLQKTLRPVTTWANVHTDICPHRGTLGL